MRIALIADAFPPSRSSAAVQMRDLSQELLRQGHEPTVFIPSPELGRSWNVSHWDGVRVVELRSTKFREVNYIRRTIAEFLMPLFMLHNLRKSPISNERWDGVIWYSPSIFLGLFAKALKRSSECSGYLIVRDVFPDWAVDMALMSRGIPYRLFKIVERYQYTVADVIGIQTNANLPYFSALPRRKEQRVEVLQNWLSDSPVKDCRISLQGTVLAGRRIFVYAGNMGAAQGMNILLDLAERLKVRMDIGFLFVGRGSDARRLRNEALNRNLTNTVFFDEIDPSEIPGLYAQCDIGLVALDVRHKTHNVPGKFLSYIQAGIPVLANINPGNDLVQLIENEAVGRVNTNNSINNLVFQAEALLKEIEFDSGLSERCKRLAASRFSPARAAEQIVIALRQSDVSAKEFNN